MDVDVEKERKEIEDAPKIPVSTLMPHTAGQSGRCNWCGQWSKDLVYVDTVHEMDRYKGVECCGRRHL